VTVLDDVLLESSRDIHDGLKMLSSAKMTAITLALVCSSLHWASASNALILWDGAALQGIRDVRLGAPMAARSLAVVHTCIYDAWAAYDEQAVGTELHGALRRPRSERTMANKEEAVSYAAYRALTDLMPSDSATVFAPLMKRLRYDPDSNSTDIETPAGIGNVACAAVLEFRHHDGSNQLGDLAQGPYTDWTGYTPVNRPNSLTRKVSIADPDRWQPLVYVDAEGDLVLQRFLVPHWCNVIPFSLSKGDQFRGQFRGPASYGSSDYQAQAEDLVAVSASLTDRQKMIAEYWRDGPGSEQPPGHWAIFAQSVSRRDHHSLDDDVKMLFALSNALFDAGIAAWDMKRAYDSVRPITAIPMLFGGKMIRAWGGPGKGAVEMDGANWKPYQPVTDPTPPFPEYVSGHSAFSAAAARILSLFTGSNRFGESVTLPSGSSKIEPGVTPSQPVVLKWDTFTDAADEAGMSRRYGGIHFKGADLAGRELGRMVAAQVWSKAQGYFDGSDKAAVRDIIPMIQGRLHFAQ
jgi:PAP2 superfamily